MPASATALSLAAEPARAPAADLLPFLTALSSVGERYRWGGLATERRSAFERARHSVTAREHMPRGPGAQRRVNHTTRAPEGRSAVELRYPFRGGR